MKYEIREVDVSKRKIDSANYTFSKSSGLTLFELIIFPDDDLMLENQAIEFWASSKETAISELTHNIKSYISLGFNNYTLSREAENYGFQCKELCELLKTFNIDITQLYGKLSMTEFLEYNDHCKYVIRKLNELYDELYDADIMFKNDTFTYINDNFDVLIIK